MAKAKKVDVKNDERRIALMRAKIMKQAQLATANDKLRKMNDIMERAKGAKIRIIRDIYPGSTVAIDDIIVQIKEQQQCVQFEVNADKVLCRIKEFRAIFFSNLSHKYTCISEPLYYNDREKYSGFFIFGRFS